MRWSDNRILRIPDSDDLKGVGLDNLGTSVLGITGDNKLRTWQLVPTNAKCVILEGERDFGNESWLSPISLRDSAVLAFAPWAKRALCAPYRSLEARDGPFYLVDLERKTFCQIRISPGDARNALFNFPSAAFALDGSRFALMGTWPKQTANREEVRHEIIIFDGATGESIGRVPFISKDPIPALSFSPTGAWLVASGWDRAIQYDATSGESKYKYEWNRSNSLQSCTFDSEGMRIGFLTDRTLEIRDCETGNVRQSIALDRPKTTRFVWGFAISRSWAVVKDMVVNLDSGERMQLRGHDTAPIKFGDRSASWTGCSLVGSLVIENELDGFGVWDARHPIEANRVIQAESSANCVQFMRAGARIISAHNAKLNIHSIGTQRLCDSFDIASIDKQSSTVSGSNSHRVVAIAPDGRRIAFVSMGTPVTLKSFDVDSQVVRKLFEISDWCDCNDARDREDLCNCHGVAQFSRDGSRLAFENRHMLRVFDCENAKCLLTTPHSKFMGAYCLNVDGTRLAISVSEDASIPDAQPKVFVRVVDVISGNEVVRLENEFVYGIRNLSFSRTDKQLYVADYWRPGFTVWELPRGNFKAEIELGRGSGIDSAVEESPDGTRLIWGGNDGSIGIADSARLQLLCELQAHSGPIHQVTFSVDGTRILSASYDEVQVRDARSGIEIYSEFLMEEKSPQKCEIVPDKNTGGG